MSNEERVSSWLSAMRGSRIVKILFGLRGVGKTAALARWRNQLLAEGYPEERLVCIDAEEPVLRQLTSADDILRYLETQFPAEGPVTLMIEEPMSFPDAVNLIERLLANRRLDLYLTLSSRRVLSGELSDYLRGAIADIELLPPPEGLPESAERSRARWNEIFLRDVLTEPGIADVLIAERVAAYFADHVGDTISLRQVAAAISPPGRLYSPNTVEVYLSALEHAHLLERCYRWKAEHEIPLRSAYRVYFTDPALRTARFGPFPTDDARRTDENRRYLALRQTHPHVYLPERPDPSQPVAFVLPPDDQP